MSRRKGRGRPPESPGSAPGEASAESSKRGKRGRGVGLLALAGLGFAAAQLLRHWSAKKGGAPLQKALPPATGRRPEGAPAREVEPPGAGRSTAMRVEGLPTPAEGPGEKQAERPPLLALPDASDTMWVPGPGGSTRVTQHNPGGGLPVLFVHGLGGSLEQWAPLIRRLGPGLRAVALDLPGHGESDPVAGVDMAQLASAVSAAADALDLRRFVLVGHDTGAAAAIELAGRARNRVAGLLLLDPNGDQTRLPAKDRQQVLDSVRNDAHGELAWHFRQVLGDGSDDADLEELEGAVVDQLRSTRPEVLAETLRAAFEYGPLPALKRFDGPVRLVVSPLNDMPFSLHRLLPDLRMAIVPGAGHWLMIDQPDAVLELLEPLLEACRDRLDSVH